MTRNKVACRGQLESTVCFFMNKSKVILKLRNATISLDHLNHTLSTISHSPEQLQHGPTAGKEAV